MTDVPTAKAEARRLIDQLPDDANWNEIIYQIYVRQSIEAGLKDCREGRTISASEVRKRLGLSS
jgi:hypothetical protein